MDIEGALDSALWPKIRIRLAESFINIRKVLDSYLQNRKVKFRYAGEVIEKQTMKVCVVKQGSVAPYAPPIMEYDY